LPCQCCCLFLSANQFVPEEGKNASTLSSSLNEDFAYTYRNVFAGLILAIRSVGTIDAGGATVATSTWTSE
jgi:hypothetical protein